MALDEPQDKETVNDIKGIGVLIADDVKNMADESTIDYLVSPRGEGFTIAKGTGSEGCSGGCSNC